MVLEAVMICLDNSDHGRNGDFSPSRLEAQQDTANLICGAKVQSNPENAIGLLTMAGKRVAVEAAPTSDMGLFVQALHGIPCDGKSDLVKGIQTAQLALKHRINRNQRQRIIAFICSPIDASEPQLEQLGKSLKKNNVALDLISFGEVPDNSRLLKRLWLSVNSGETSHLYEETEEGVNLASAVMSSPILSGEGGGGGGGGGGFIPGEDGAAGGGGGALNEFGVDPSVDPDLYMALRLSLEDERARQQRQQQTGSVPTMRTGGAAGAAETTPEGPAPLVPTPIPTADVHGPASGFVTSETPPVTDPPQTSGVGDSGNATNPNNDGPTSIEEIMAMNIDEDLKQALLQSMLEYRHEMGSGNEDAPADDDVGGAAKKRVLTRDSNSTHQPPSKRIREKQPENNNGVSHGFVDVDGETGDRRTDPAAQPPDGSTAAAAPPPQQPDQEILSHLMRSIPGVDFNDPEVQAALRGIELEKKNDSHEQKPKDDRDDDQTR